MTRLMARLIASVILIVLSTAGAAWAACSGGALPDGRGGCYFPPFATGINNSREKKHAIAARARAARSGRALARVPWSNNTRSLHAQIRFPARARSALVARLSGRGVRFGLSHETAPTRKL